MANEYEILSPVDFGVLRNDKGNPKPKEEQPELHGVMTEGTVSLNEDEAAPLLEAGAIRPVDAPAVSTVQDNPEEYGYEGEALRNDALENDPVYSGEAGASATPAAQHKAEELGVDLSEVSGSGNDGKIVVADVEKAASK